MADTAPKPFVFVLMPFDSSFNDVYQLGIKPAAEGAGAYCERIDEQIFAESILARIYNQIAKADLIVADMTGRNPNVFYEVGYAHALGQTSILLTRNSEDIPFDLKPYPHIVYEGSIAALKDKLEKRIAHHLANPAQQTKATLSLPDFTIAGNRIEAGICIAVSDDESDERSFAFSIGIHNPQECISDWSEFSAGLIFPEDFTPPRKDIAIQLPDKRYLYHIGRLGMLLPGAWDTEHMYLPLECLRMPDVVEVELRIFTPNGPRSTIFSLQFA